MVLQRVLKDIDFDEMQQRTMDAIMNVLNTWKIINRQNQRFVLHRMYRVLWKMCLLSE